MCQNLSMIKTVQFVGLCHLKWKNKLGKCCMLEFYNREITKNSSIFGIDWLTGRAAESVKKMSVTLGTS